MSKRPRVDESAIVRVTAPSTGFVLVCGKCGKRAGRKGLRSEIKLAFKARRGGQGVKVVETGCLGICPKGGIAVASGMGLAQGEVVVFSAAASAEEAVAALVLGPT